MRTTIAMASGLLTLAVAMGGSVVAQTRDGAVRDQSRASAVRMSLPRSPPALSQLCRSKTIAGEAYRRPLRGLARALRSSRTVRVLAIGSSSTVGVGASKPSEAYIAKLETGLEGVLQDVDVDVVGRGMSGEMAQGAADRMQATVAEVKPDLVVWQVGTNDALRHVDVAGFKRCLKTTLAWLGEQRIDVVLVDPQFGEKLALDEHYGRIVGAVAEVAQEARVMLVDRFTAMRELARERGEEFYLAGDQLHLNDNGHRCMGEQLARSIVAGLLQDDAPSSPAQ